MMRDVPPPEGGSGVRAHRRGPSHDAECVGEILFVLKECLNRWISLTLSSESGAVPQEVANVRMSARTEIALTAACKARLA